MVKLTKEQYYKAGKEIFNDARCNADVKTAVLRGTAGVQDKAGLFTYTPNGSCGRKNEWYDLIIISAAK